MTWTNADLLSITLRSKCQCKVNRNSYIFIQEHSRENIVCEMAANLSGGDEMEGKGMMIYLTGGTGDCHYDMDEPLSSSDYGGPLLRLHH